MADDKQTDNKMNEQILQLNTDAGLANYNVEEPKRQFIDGLTRQAEGAAGGGYDSAIKSFFGTGKNLYIQYKIAKKNQINLMMQITESNTDQYRQINALKKLAGNANNLVIYATTKIENSNDFKECVEKGLSFKHILVLNVKETDNINSIDLSNDEFKPLNEFITKNLVTTSSSGGKAFSNSDFVSAIKEQFGSIDEIEILPEDENLHLVIKNSLANIEVLDASEQIAILAVDLIKKYTNCQICWVTEKNIYPADVVIRKCAELKRKYHLKLEINQELNNKNAKKKPTIGLNK